MSIGGDICPSTRQFDNFLDVRHKEGHSGLHPHVVNSIGLCSAVTIDVLLVGEALLHLVSLSGKSLEGLRLLEGYLRLLLWCADGYTIGLCRALAQALRSSTTNGTFGFVETEDCSLITFARAIGHHSGGNSQMASGAYAGISILIVRETIVALQVPALQHRTPEEHSCSGQQCHL